MTDLIKRFCLSLENDYLGKDAFHYTSCHSTQITLKELMDEGAKIGTTVIADAQPKGRGQHGKQWIDLGPGQLFTSMCISTTLPPQQLPTINLALSLSVVETFQKEFAIEGLQVKWPNDIYLHRKKLGGIISEIYHHPETTCLIVGLGINFSGDVQTLPPQIQATTTTLAKYNIEISRFDFMGKLLRAFEKTLKNKNQALACWIQEKFERHNMHQGQHIQIKDGDIYKEGHCQGIDTLGRLLLKAQNNDTIPISSGSIIM